MDRRKKLVVVVVVVHGVSWVWSRLQFGMGTVALVGPQVGFRPHGSRASSRPRCIYLRIGRILPLSFSSTRLVYTRPLSFVRKKARLHARQKEKKRIHLPRCTTCLIWAARGSLRQDYRPITLSLSKQDGPGRPVCGLLWCHTRVSQTTGRGIHGP